MTVRPKACVYKGAWAFLAVATALLLAACGLAGSASQAPPPAQGPDVSAAAPTAAPTSSPSAQAPAVVARDADNGRTVQLKTGQALTVVLGSTYWSFGPATTPAVLTPAAAPVVSPQASGCPAGGGCGTVTAEFAAVAPGQAQITATRVPCSDTPGCTTSFHLTVVVSA